MVPPTGLLSSPPSGEHCKEYGPLTLATTFGDRRPPPEVRFGIGDVISVSIFEAGRRWPIDPE